MIAAALGGATITLVGVPGAAAPGLTPNEPATAIVGRTTVFLEATFTGSLRYQDRNGASRREPVVVRRRCSAVVVNRAGYAVTAGGCVRPDESELLADALRTLGRTLVEANRLPVDGVDAFVDEIGGTAEFSGPRRGTKPLSVLYGQHGVARPGLTVAPAQPVTVVLADPATTGNPALVKFARSDLPVVEIDSSDPPGPGAELVLLGYGPGGSQADATEYPVRTKPATVTRSGGTDRLVSDDDLGAVSRGGPVVDADGHLRAILDRDPTATDGAVRHLVPATRVRELLARAGVPNQLSELDRAYRNALDAYFAGQFSVAVRRFDALLRLAPSHGAAQTYRKRAQERLDVDGDAVENSADWLRYLLSAAAGALVLVAAGRGRRLVRRIVRPGSTVPVDPPTSRVRPADADAGTPPETAAPPTDTTAGPPATGVTGSEPSVADATAVAPRVPVTPGSAGEGGARHSANPTGLAPR